MGHFAPILLWVCCVLGSCIQDEVSDCLVPHNFEFDWSGQVEPDSYRGQETIRLYPSAGTNASYDTPPEGVQVLLRQTRYRALTFNEQLGGLSYGALESIESAVGSMPGLSSTRVGSEMP